MSADDGSRVILPRKRLAMHEADWRDVDEKTK